MARWAPMSSVCEIVGALKATIRTLGSELGTGVDQPPVASHPWGHLTSGPPENVTQLGDYRCGRSVASHLILAGETEER